MHLTDETFSTYPNLKGQHSQFFGGAIARLLPTIFNANFGYKIRMQNFNANFESETRTRNLHANFDSKSKTENVPSKIRSEIWCEFFGHDCFEISFFVTSVFGRRQLSKRPRTNSTAMLRFCFGKFSSWGTQVLSFPKWYDAEVQMFVHGQRRNSGP